VQSCGFCEDAACGDNTNPTIDAMKADLARVTGERDAVMENDVKFRGEHIYLEGLKKDCLRLLDQRDKYMDKCDALTADNARVKGELSGADDAGYQCYLAHQPDPKPSYIEWLKKGMEYLEEAAHAAAQGHSPAEYLATQAPTTLRDELARVKGERDEARKLVHNISDKFDVFDERLPIRTGETRQLFDTDEYRNLSDAITSAITSIDAAREVIK
jgi:hypothetical protein